MIHNHEQWWTFLFRSSATRQVVSLLPSPSFILCWHSGSLEASFLRAGTNRVTHRRRGREQGEKDGPGGARAALFLWRSIIVKCRQHRSYHFDHLKMYCSGAFSTFHSVLQTASLSSRQTFPSPHKDLLKLYLPAADNRWSVSCVCGSVNPDISFKWNHIIHALLCLPFSLNVTSKTYIHAVAGISGLFLLMAK